jgi:hypothetical protein
LRFGNVQVNRRWCQPVRGSFGGVLGAEQHMD